MNDWGAVRFSRRADFARRTTMCLPAPKDLKRPRLPFACSFCASRFSSDERMDVHVAAEHVASADDSSEGARAKPVVRVNGRVFLRRALARAEHQAIGTGSSSQKSIPQDERQRLLQEGSSRRSLPLPSLQTPPSNSTMSSHIAPDRRAKRSFVLCPKCKSPTQVLAPAKAHPKPSRPRRRGTYACHLNKVQTCLPD
jgi:hypothetical protein